MTWLANITFGTPWILAALIVLPAIWFLLRVTPPLPKRVVFPPLRLLLGLRDEEQTPAGTPWWLMLLRLIAAAAVIVALAEPQIGRKLELPGSGPVVLLVDNGWTAAANWSAHKNLAEEAVRLAAGQRRAVAIVQTAARPDTNLLDAERAERAVRTLEPRPWLADRSAALAALSKTTFKARPEILWLSDGIDDGHAREAAKTLSRLGPLRIYADSLGKGPLAVTGIVNTADGFELDVLRPGTGGARNGAVTAYGDQGQILGTAHFHLADGRNRAAARLGLPLEMRNETARVEIDNVDDAGATWLLDRGAPRRSVGLVAATNTGSEEPLLSGLFYLQRALSPYADLHQGTISELLARGVSVLIVADIGKIAGADYDRVAKFVEGGGLLIRFAGDRMASGVDDLVPVPLRSGGRYLGSALAWAAPQHLAAFADDSPFGGLAVPSDVTVSRQILAEPSIELSSHSWARLTDGTPMVTAARRGKGWIVLFHVTASPAWSTLPLSGLYVEMLRRLLPLSAGTNPEEMRANTSLPAVSTLDGFGRLATAGAEAQPIRAADVARTEPSRRHPPGLYGVPGLERALNAARGDTVLLPFAAPNVVYYASRAAVALQTPLLLIAMLLLLADFMVSLALRGYTPGLKSFTRIAGALFVGLVLFHTGQARADDAFDMKAALDTRLAYVITGVPDVDAMSKAGLIGLGDALAARTSYVPKEPMGVNLDTDDLSFFPLLYWPMDPREKDLSPTALSKIADYMRNGGTILIDTRDLTLGPTRGSNSAGQQTLRRLLGKIDLPPLEPLPPDHVLTKAFYLLSDFPGRWDGGTVWVQALPPGRPDDRPVRGGDGVSPVIIGGNDWAAAWAVDAQGRPLADVSPGGARQREMAIRFGINVVMYALTGNYKADQVHVPAILQRLGQ
ncbi:MAG: DUF4159 domain-containing protein [Alphaproteobacteria bacterium]|nr:DUF4159 domain-containing protein [Alphaproteobacteria bacterium]